MDRAYFINELRNIYATHGKNMVDGIVISSIFRDVENYPKEFMDFCRDILRDYEKLPSNLGREMRLELWPQYLSKHPEAKAKGQHACHQCAAGLPGWFWARKPDGARCMCKCLCNTDPRYAHIPAYSWQSLGRVEGYTVVDTQESYMQAVLRGMEVSLKSGLVNLKKAVGCVEVVDPFRVRHLPEAERARYGEAVNV